MDNSPLVSVLINCFNGEPFVEEAVRSVIDQSYTNWELYFWDNASTDRTGQIVRGFKDERIRYFKSPVHTELGSARIAAFPHLRGKYVAILDADDRCTPDRLARQVQHLEQNEQTLAVASSYIKIDEEGQELDTEYLDWLHGKLPEVFVYSNPIAHSTVMYDRSAACEVGGYDYRFIFAQDYALWIELSQLGTFKIIDEPLTCIRVNTESMSNQASYSRIRHNESLQLMRRALRNLPSSEEAQIKHRENVVKRELRLGRKLLAEHSYWAGMAHLIRTVLKEPAATVRYLTHKVGT